MDEIPVNQGASTRTKILFWLILGSLSVALTEVVVYSSPLPFFTGWGILVVCPLYTLHTLVLAFVVFRGGKVRITSLYLAGAIFGMYEAYITKIIWNPDWAENANMTVGGVYVLHTALLVLFCHSVLAFMIPVFAAENLFTNSSETFEALPKRIRLLLGGPKRIFMAAILFGLCCGMNQSVNSPSPAASLLSAGSAVGVLFALGLLFRWVTGKRKYGLRELLPSNRQALVLSLLLLFMYLFWGAVLRPGALPETFIPHLTVWVIYAVLLFLLYHNLKSSGPIEQSAGPSIMSGRWWKVGAAFGVMFPVSSAVLVLVKPLSAIIVIAFWIIACCVGAGILVYLFFNIIRTKFVVRSRPESYRESK